MATGLLNAIGDCVGEFGAGQTYVPPEHYFICFQELSGGIADAIGNFGIQLVRNLATDVVGRRLKYRSTR